MRLLRCVRGCGCRLLGWGLILLRLLVGGSGWMLLSCCSMVILGFMSSFVVLFGMSCGISL